MLPSPSTAHACIDEGRLISSPTPVTCNVHIYRAKKKGVQKVWNPSQKMALMTQKEEEEEENEVGGDDEADILMSGPGDAGAGEDPQSGLHNPARPGAMRGGEPGARRSSAGEGCRRLGTAWVGSWLGVCLGPAAQMRGCHMKWAVFPNPHGAIRGGWCDLALAVLTALAGGG